MTVDYIPAKTIVARTKSNEWFGAEYSMNIYRGCNHGCIYCDSRSDCYQVADFDRVRVKADALTIIRSDLERKRRKGVIATGAMSDSYSPLERELELTRGALALAERFRFGLAVATKSDLVNRDADLFAAIRKNAPVNDLTLSSLSERLGDAGYVVTPQAVFYCLKRMGWSYKKNDARKRARPG